MGSAVKDFTKGNTMKQLVIFSAPLFLSNLLQVVYNMVDMLIVGDVLGKEGISAVTVGGDLSNLLTFIAIGFSNAGQVIIAQYIGGGKKEKRGGAVFRRIKQKRRSILSTYKTRETERSFGV